MEFLLSLLWNRGPAGSGERPARNAGKRSRSAWLAAVCLMLLASPLLLGQERTWTSAQGQQIRAELVKFDGKTVWLRLAATGKVQEMPISILSPEDQRLLQTGKIRAGSDAEPAPTTEATATRPRTPEEIRADVARKMAAKKAAAGNAAPDTPPPPGPNAVGGGASAPSSVAGEGGDVGMLAELQSVKSLLPITPEEIVALEQTFSQGQKVLVLSVDGAGVAAADEAQKLRLLKLSKTRLRITGFMGLSNNGEIVKKNSGSLNIYVIDTARKRILAKGLEPFAKLVPS